MAAAARQHDTPRSLPDEFLSGGWVGGSKAGRGGVGSPARRDSTWLADRAGCGVVAAGKSAGQRPSTAAIEPAPHGAPLPTCLPLPAEDSLVFLNIPMDAETPSLRLLRPQVRAAGREGRAVAEHSRARDKGSTLEPWALCSNRRCLAPSHRAFVPSPERTFLVPLPNATQALVQEEAIRHYAATLAYRMNLAHARRWGSCIS